MENMNTIPTINGTQLGITAAPPHINPETTMSVTINDIALALSKAQSELESANKDQDGYGYSYSDLTSVISTAKSVLAKYELAITQLLGSDSKGNPSVTTILSHSSGQFFKSVVSIAPVEMKSCNAVQCAGATWSYLRRYSYQAILGMSSEDNDASSQGFSKPEKSTGLKKKTTKTTQQKFRSSSRKPAVDKEVNHDI